LLVSCDRNADMINLTDSNPRYRYTVIETIYGEVKLIRSSEQPSSNIETLRFPNLSDCMDYLNRNQFRIDVLHSGRREKKQEPRHTP